MATGCEGEIVVVLGMHRSGTSAVAGYLHSLGLSLPSQSLPAHPVDNPEGYFEAREVVDINNRVLSALGLTWQSVQAVTNEQFESAGLVPLKQEIDEYLSRVCRNGATLLFKDPRLCRLLPLWWPAMQQRASTIAAVNVLRHPDAVVDSLARRANDEALAPAAITDPLHASLLWLRYNLDAHRHLLALAADTCTLDYEAFSTQSRQRLSLRHWLVRALPAFQPDDSSNEFTLRSSRNEHKHSLQSTPHWQSVLRATYHQLRTRPASYDSWLSELDDLISTPIPAPHQTVEGLDKPDTGLLCTAVVKHASGQVVAPCAPAHGDTGRWLDHVGNTARAVIGIANIRSQVRAKINTRHERRHPDYLFISDNPRTRGHIYRVKNPLDALTRAGENAAWLTPDAALASPELARNANTLIVHRCQWSTDLARLYTIAHRAGTRIVYDIDDLVFDPALIDRGEIDFIRQLHAQAQDEWRDHFLGWRRALLAADSALVPTPTLQNAITALGLHCDVKPNGLGPETIALSQHWANAHSDQRQHFATGDTGVEVKRLGYASGTPTHEADFATIQPLLEAFLSEHPDWRLTVIGHLNTETLQTHLGSHRVEHRPLVEHVNLPFELARLDACLAPLVPGNRFCAGKSPLKWFEAAACGVVTLATDTGALSHWINHGEDGLLATTQAEWGQNLDFLTGRPAMVADIAATAKNRIITELSEDALSSDMINALTP